MKPIYINEDLTKRLEPGERILSTISGGTDLESVEYNATDRKILRYARPAGFFSIFSSAKKKDFTDAIEYSRITNTEFISHHPNSQLIAGLIIGLITVGMGVAIAFLFWGDAFSYIGWAIAAIGVVCAALLFGVKQTYCQFMIAGLAKLELTRWRIYMPRAGGQTEIIRQFAKIVDDI
ncbi:MAG: hypothetical protein ACYDG5_07185, partial [Dehalococcoidales bacterium]